MTDLKDTIKKYLPSYVRDKTELGEFTDGVGNLLDSFKSAINDMKFYLDPNKIDSSYLDALGNQFDLNFPKGITEDKKRIQIMDAIHTYRSTGTRSALLRIFRLIGWDVTVDELWVVMPGDTVPVGVPVGVGEVIFGEEAFDLSDGKIYANLYDDFGNTYNHIKAKGEKYADGITGTMSKLPYIRITINAQDYGDLTQDYLDPDTDIPYSYTSSEQFSIVQETIKYFLESGRPANVVIYDINTFFRLFEDEFPTISDSSVLTPFAHGKYDGSSVYGVGLDLVNFDETYELLQFGTEVPIDLAPPTIEVDRTIPAGVSGPQMHLQSRSNAEVVITSAPTVDIVIQTSTSTRKSIAAGTAAWVDAYTIVAGSPFPFTLAITNVRGVRLNILGAPTISPIVWKVRNL